tara:strand:- start:46 stop:687 length:642 start_codon:yes stop_codon:yes gene_type:complete
VAISKANFNSFNVTPTASKFITFNSSNDGLAADDVGGSLVLISTSTASNSSSLSFTSGIDSTYKEYIFKFINIHPVTNSQHFQVNFRDGSSAFDATKTTTAFYAYHDEADGSTDLTYLSGLDLAQSTAYQSICGTVGNGNDESFSGTMHLFDPSNTTFVKHFSVRGNTYSQDDLSADMYFAGYCNVTAAIDGVDFKFASGNIDSGVIKLYGVN